MPNVTVTVQHHTGKILKENFIYLQSPYLLRPLDSGTCPPDLHGFAPV